MSLTLKFALFTSLLCAFIIGGISYLSYRMAYVDLETSLGQRLEAVVRSGAMQIDGNLHDQVQTMEDQNSQAFLSIRDYLHRLKRANDLQSPVYTFRQVGDELRFVVMTNERPFIGDPYQIRREMLPTLQKGMPTHTGVYEDENGGWISAYAPILDGDGHLAGLLEADIHVDHFIVILRGKFRRLLLKGLAFMVFAVFMSFLLAKTVTRKLNYLTRITEKISLGKTETPIVMKGKDEVSKLAASLERMRESLKIAAEMID